MSALPTRLGRYDVLGELATGGMAQILLARIVGPSGFERAVVIKRILPHLLRRESFVAMFLDEARIAAGIRHHNVVHVHELMRDGDDLSLVMEYLEGESVASLTRRMFTRDEPLAPRLAAHIVAEAAAGLHAAHELVDADGRPQSLVHRDVSPQNLFVTYDGQVKVIDFGIAKAADRITETEAGQIKGKFEYMSPEQCRGEPLDRRSDVFALGVILYELTTGRRLFRRREGAAAVMRAITSEPIVPPSRVVEGYPPALEKACMRALENDRDARTPTAAELRRELLAAMRALGPSDEHETEALAASMRRLFADRLEEKREMLRRMRAGSAVTHVPAGEIDVDVDVPELPAALRSAARTELHAAGQAPASTTTRRSRRLGVGLGALVVVALIGGAVFAARGAKSPVRADATAGPAPLVATASSPSATASAPSAAPTIVVHLATRPDGAGVSIDGKDAGTTPLDLRLPRGAEPVALLIQRAGYEPLAQSVVPDADQKLLLDLRPRTAPLHKAASAPTTSAPEPFTKWN